MAGWAESDPIIAPFIFGRLTPYNDPTTFQQDTPAYHASQIQTPLLIFHGSKDHLPVTALENVYWTVASNNIPARMVKFIGAGHGLVDDEQGRDIPEYELYAAQEMVQWFRRYLSGDEQTTRKPMS